MTVLWKLFDLTWCGIMRPFSLVKLCDEGICCGFKMMWPLRRQLERGTGWSLRTKNYYSYSFCLVSCLISRANVTLIPLTFCKMLLNVNRDRFYMGHDHYLHTCMSQTLVHQTHTFYLFLNLAIHVQQGPKHANTFTSVLDTKCFWHEIYSFFAVAKMVKETI